MICPLALEIISCAQWEFGVTIMMGIKLIRKPFLFDNPIVKKVNPKEA